MLAGNHQQVHRAGVLQHLPILGCQPGTVPQHQSCQARLATLGVDGNQPLADRVAPGMAGRRQALTVFYRASGANALCQQPCLLIKTVKIEQPGRPLKRDCQAPALPAAYLGPTVPGHTDALGQPGVTRPAVGQIETHPGAGLLWQPNDAPLQPSRLAIERRWQAIIQRPLRTDARPAQAQQEKRQGRRTKWQQHQNQHQHGYQPSSGR